MKYRTLRLEKRSRNIIGYRYFSLSRMCANRYYGRGHIRPIKIRSRLLHPVLRPATTPFGHPRHESQTNK